MSPCRGRDQKCQAKLNPWPPAGGLLLGLGDEGAAFCAAAAFLRPLERQARRIQFFSAPPSKRRSRILGRQRNFAEISFGERIAAIVQETNNLSGRHSGLIVEPVRRDGSRRVRQVRRSIKLMQRISPCWGFARSVCHLAKVARLAKAISSVAFRSKPKCDGYYPGPDHHLFR